MKKIIPIALTLLTVSHADEDSLFKHRITFGLGISNDVLGFSYEVKLGKPNQIGVIAGIGAGGAKLASTISKNKFEESDFKIYGVDSSKTTFSTDFPITFGFERFYEKYGWQITYTNLTIHSKSIGKVDNFEYTQNESKLGFNAYTVNLIHDVGEKNGFKMRYGFGAMYIQQDSIITTNPKEYSLTGIQKKKYSSENVGGGLLNIVAAYEF